MTLGEPEPDETVPAQTAPAPASAEMVTIIDTSRMWCSRMPLLADLYPEARVIVCVRELVWVIDSFERIWQSRIDRLDALLASDPHDDSHDDH